MMSQNDPTQYENLATINAVRFLMNVWPFRDIMKQRIILLTLTLLLFLMTKCIEGNRERKNIREFGRAGEVYITLHKKIKFSTKDFFSKRDQILEKLRVWSDLLKKSLMEKFIFVQCCQSNSKLRQILRQYNSTT